MTNFYSCSLSFHLHFSILTWSFCFKSCYFHRCLDSWAVQLYSRICSLIFAVEEQIGAYSRWGQRLVGTCRMSFEHLVLCCQCLGIDLRHLVSVGILEHPSLSMMTGYNTDLVDFDWCHWFLWFRSTSTYYSLPFEDFALSVIWGISSICLNSIEIGDCLISLVRFPAGHLNVEHRGFDLGWHRTGILVQVAWF